MTLPFFNRPYGVNLLRHCNYLPDDWDLPGRQDPPFWMAPKSVDVGILNDISHDKWEKEDKPLDQ